MDNIEMLPAAAFVSDFRCSLIAFDCRSKADC